MNVIMGIDVGTTSISIVLLEQGGRRVVYMRNLTNDSKIPGQPPWRQDPERIWSLVLPEYRKLRETRQVTAVGITCQMHGILYVDGRGRAVSPLYTWQDEQGELPYGNGRTYRQQLNAVTGYSQVRGIAAGSITHFFLTKEGGLPAGAVKFCTIGDYLAMRLTGEKTPTVHISNGAGFGLVDLDSGSYDLECIEKAGMDGSFFPEIKRGYAIAGRTPDGVPVSVALGDNQASFLGAVEDWEHEALLNLGTGGQISRYSRRPVDAPGIENRPFLNRDFIAVYTSHCGGRAYAALERFFRQVLEMAGVPADSLYDAMERALGCRTPGGEALLVEPAFCGTRADPAKRCAITNVTLENFTPADLTAGFLEGICRELMPAFEVFRASGQIRRLVGSGNTIRKNETFQGMIARLFDVPLRLPEVAEEAAVGAALFAGRMRGEPQ